MSGTIVGESLPTVQDLLCEYGSWQALNKARGDGSETRETQDYSPFSDEYIVRTKRFEDGQQEVVAFSTRVLRHFNEIRLRPKGARGKREALEGESETDVSTRSDKSLRTSIERSKRFRRIAC